MEGPGDSSVRVLPLMPKALGSISYIIKKVYRGKALGSISHIIKKVYRGIIFDSILILYMF